MMNEVHTGHNVEVLKNLESSTVDLTVTSPPYDDLRKYNGYDFDLDGLIGELYRVTKEGGVVVWVVGDATVNGSESCTSFEQAIQFVYKGFNLHDTMIWEKPNPMPTTAKRYLQSFEYMFVFSKGKPKTFNPIMIPCTYAGTKTKPSNWTADGEIVKGKRRVINSHKKHSNIFKYLVGSNSGSKNIKHPAVFPEKLAEDHILSWSNEHDVVLDPMCGSGTTLKMAKLLNRNYIGIDTSEDYTLLAKNRLEGL